MISHACALSQHERLTGRLAEDPPPWERATIEKRLRRIAPLVRRAHTKKRATGIGREGGA